MNQLPAVLVPQLQLLAAASVAEGPVGPEALPLNARHAHAPRPCLCMWRAAASTECAVPSCSQPSPVQRMRVLPLVSHRVDFLMPLGSYQSSASSPGSTFSSSCRVLKKPQSQWDLRRYCFVEVKVFWISLFFS